MPDLASFEILSLDGMDYEDFDWKTEGIDYDFGDGYGASITTSSPGGLHGWRIFSGCLPNDEAYSNLINGLPRWQYYFEFFQRHRGGGKRVFEINFGGKRYHASFVDRVINPKVFSYDLFGDCTLAIKQQKVPGIFYNADNSIAAVANLPGVYSHHTADTFSLTGTAWLNNLDTGNSPLSAYEGDVMKVEDVQNDLPVVRFNSIAADGYVKGEETPVLKEMVFVMKVREATWSNFGGVLTDDDAVSVLFGDTGTTQFFDSAIANFQYRLNGVTLTQALATSPMNVFGIVHARSTTGITLENLQVGKHTDEAGRFAKIDVGEIIFGEDTWTEQEITDLTAYLTDRWGL
jgi:hypothetical protein